MGPMEGVSPDEARRRVDAMRAACSPEATRAARAGLLRAVERAGAYSLTDEQRAAARD